MRTSLLVVGIICAGVMSPSVAEIARIRMGPDRFGQGWLFLDYDRRCKVVTAGHVIAPAGRPLPFVVRDRRGREFASDEPEIVSLDPDIALVRVNAGPNPNDCSPSRMSRIGIDRRVLGLVDGVIETTGETEIQTVPVDRVATLVDTAGGEIFAVRPRDPAVRLAQGWSGSIVRDGRGPVGVVSAVDQAANEALAVRIDVLERLASAVLTPGSGRTGFSAVRLDLGETADPAQGPAGLFDPDRPPWRVRASGNRLVLVVSAERAMRFREIRLEVDPAGEARLRAMQVEVGTTRGDGTRFLPLASCATNAPALVLSCPFLDQYRGSIRLTVTVEGDGQTALRRLAIE